MSDISINQVKLIKQGEKLHVSYKETSEDGMTSNVDKTCGNPVHPDLVKAVNGLATHLAIMTDYLTEKQAADKEQLEKFVVSGYSIGGKEDDEGIVITGYRKTRSGKTVTLNTPFLKLDSEPETYYLIKHLNNQIETIENEVEKYLFEGKRAPDTQQQLPFPEENAKKDPVTKMQVVPPAGDDDNELSTVFGNDLETEVKGNGMTVVTDNDPFGITEPASNTEKESKPKKDKKPTKKKVAQTADAPSGEVVVNE